MTSKTSPSPQFSQRSLRGCRDAYGYKAAEEKRVNPDFSSKVSVFSMDKAGFEIFSTTADGGFHLWAPSLPELFRQAGCALFSMMTDIEQVKVREYFDVSLEAPSVEDLLVNWLNELIYLSEIHFVFLSDFNISEADSQHLTARVGGEHMDQDRHCFDNEIKAATYHKLSITLNDAYRATIVVDL